MLPNLPREAVQFCSLMLFGAGAIILIAGGADVAEVRATGIVLCAAAIWSIMMSESVLLGKVQIEMQTALKKFNDKRDEEVQELIGFLKQSKINAHPMESSEGMRVFIQTLPYPSFIMSSMMGILSTNSHMTNLLGWEPGELDGRPAYEINDASVMSAVGAIAASQEHVEKKEISLRYVYLHKNDTRIYGNLHVIKLPDSAFFMVFHPDEDNIITDEQLKNMLS